ncbi:MAG: hypothetical protein IPG17_30370 [Sandaracinaceae bacterium]|nr:hypothetical protein [Sandaracinaceae bacterium]
MTRVVPLALILGGALASAALVVLAVSTPKAKVEAPNAEPRRTVMDIAARVIDYVARGESKGKFWAQNRNTDGQGLSYGLIQWTQRSGALGKLLVKMNAADPAAFASTFGPDAALLLKTTTSPTEAVRMSLPLWQEPWTSRFTAAGHVRAFQLAQAEAAKTGASWKAALDISEIFGVRTERSLVLFFDRANHHGGHGARKLANGLKAELTSSGPVRVAYPELLARYARTCAAPYRRTSAPAETTTSSGKTWKKVGDEWHLYAGKADLYAIIVRRTGEILADPGLTDTALEVA